MGTKKKKRKFPHLATNCGIRVEESSASPSRIRLRGKRRSMHRHKLLYGKILAFPSSRVYDSAPMALVDSVPLPTLLKSPLPNPSVLRHLSKGLPKVKNIIKSLHSQLIALDYPSSNSWMKIPVTANQRSRTIRPMSRTVTPTQFKKGFCARLKAARTMAGFEQEDVAKALGIPANTYSTYERRTLLPHHLIPVACDFLGIEMPYLYGENRRKAASGEYQK